MEFFVSWTRQDPVFHEYDSNANVLISPHYVNHSWNISKWQKLPHKLIIDSGAYSVNEKSFSCDDILRRQTFMTDGWDDQNNLYFSHPDLLIPLKATFSTMNQQISKSLDRAKKYISKIRKKKIKCNPIGVIHGFDEETLISSYNELIDSGYKHFAIGSLAVRISHSKNLCLTAIKILSDFGVKPLHVFGVLWPSHAIENYYKLSSFDSAAPSKLGFYGTVLYGPKLDHYVISPNSKQKLRDRFWKFRKSLDNPLPCDCPVCKLNSKRLNSTNEKKSKIDRIIHNYFQIKWATEKIN